jgi:hypothetical protein
MKRALGGYAALTAPALALGGIVTAAAAGSARRSCR